MTDASLVSVITPLYNYEEYITDAVESVLEQSYKNWEMIIVDDCSSDNSAEIAGAFSAKDRRIKLIKLSKNRGIASARNTALEMAQGDFIAFLDSDDTWYPEKLETQLKFMIEENCPISFTSYELMDASGNLMNHIIRSVDSIDLYGYLKNTIIGFSTAMIDLRKTGRIRFMDLPSRVDTQLWITLFKKGFTAKGIDRVLTRYRINHQSVSSNKLKAALQVWNLYYRVEKIGFLASARYFVSYAFNAMRKRIVKG